MREIIEENQFKKDFKKIAKSGRYLREDIMKVIDSLANDEMLLYRHQDHKLNGNWEGARECHIKPDWLLIYRKTGDDKLYLLRTGSHHELFSK